MTDIRCHNIFKLKKGGKIADKNKSDDSLKKNVIFSFSMIGQIGFATAVPLVVFGLLGRYLDRKLGTSPYLFLLGIVIATVQVYFYIRGIVKKAMKNFK